MRHSDIVWEFVPVVNPIHAVSLLRGWVHVNDTRQT